MPDVIVRHLFYPDNKNRKYTIFLYICLLFDNNWNLHLLLWKK